MKKIAGFLKEERKKYTIYPESNNIFRAYKECPYVGLKVVILGQDPYHTPKKATGLAFSVPEDENPPPSLRNIFSEIERDFDTLDLNQNPDLTRWANQGVFLLNTSLTVRKGQADSHKAVWYQFIDKTIEYINASPVPTVFMLWGNNAKKYLKVIDTDHHLALTASHPSPFSCHLSFNGCKHFSKANEFLEKNNLKPIDWL